MSGHRSVLNIHFVFFSMCFLPLCNSKTLNASRPNRSTEDGICYESQTTIEKVNVCPKDIETINRRSNTKNCSRYQTCDGHELVYHCVMNGGGPVEVCAPRRHITGRFCPYYENGLGRVIEDTRIQCIKCPFQYQSDEYFKNSECVPASVTNEGSSEQTSTISANIIETKKKSNSTNNGPSFSEGQEIKDSNSIIQFELIENVYRLKNESVASGENVQNKEDGKKCTDQSVTCIVVPVVVISICTGLGILLYYYFRKRLTTFCTIHEDGLKHNNIRENSLEPQFNDQCHRSCEPMLIKKEYASF